MIAEFDFAFAGDVERQLRSILFPLKKPWQPERGVIGIVYRSTGIRRQTLILSELVPPQAGEVTWTGDGLIFSTPYKSRAISLVASKPNAGLIFIHTHGAKRDGSAPAPSQPDLAADQRDLYYLGQSLADGAPLVAGIADDNFCWTVREYQFNYPTTAAEVRQGNISSRQKVLRYLQRVRVVNGKLTLADTNAPRHIAGVMPNATLVMADSTIRLWGKDGQDRLRRIRVAIVGLGGVGSILAEHAVRLGVRDLVLIDFDRINKDNFNRSQGATRLDYILRRHKVVVAARLARKSAVNNDVNITEIIGSVVEKETVKHLLDCDIVLNASDSPWGLQVLDQLAHAHLIPVITGGTVIKGRGQAGILIAGKSEVAVSNPGVLCLECAGSYQRADVTEAMSPPSMRGPCRYLDNVDEAAALPPEVDRAPSVIATNGLVASLMLLKLQAIVVGTTPDTIPGTQRYHLLEGTLDMALRTQCEMDCVRKETTGTGNTYGLPTGVDEDFKAAQAADPKNRFQWFMQALRNIADLR